MKSKILTALFVITLSACSSSTSEQTNVVPKPFTGPSSGTVTTQPLTDIGNGFEATTLFGGTSRATVAIRLIDEAVRLENGADRNRHFNAAQEHVANIGCPNPVLESEKAPTAKRVFWNFSFACTSQN